MQSVTLVALLSALLAAAAPAQRPADVVRWSGEATAPAKPGGTLSVAMTADVQPGWYLYGLTQPKGGPKPLTFEVGKGAPFTIGLKNVKGPEPSVTSDPNFDLETRQHAGKAVFAVPVTIAASVGPGRHTIPIDVTFQSCGNGLCLRPFTQTVPVDVVIER